MLFFIVYINQQSPHRRLQRTQAFYAMSGIYMTIKLFLMYFITVHFAINLQFDHILL